MSFGVSTSSNPQNTTNTQTTQSVAGSSASYSPTVFSGGPVAITDAGQTANALAGMNSVALAALDNQQTTTAGALTLLSDFNARQQQGVVDSTKSNTDLLASVLANNQTLAQNSQSGGATIGMALTQKVIYGALAVVALIMFLALKKR